LAFASSGGFGAEVEKRLSAARAASLVLFYLIGALDANVLRFSSHFFAKFFRFFPEINEKTPLSASRKGENGAIFAPDVGGFTPFPAFARLF
jgi:hypothetical protein